MPQALINVQIKIPPELYEECRAHADEYGESVPKYIISAIKNKIKANKRKKADTLPTS